MAKIETIVFDLDGTLYQDRTYVTIFLQALLKNTIHAPYLSLICEEAQQVLSGHHHLKPGQFVDMLAYSFQGYEPLLYRKGLDIQDYADFNERYSYVGDGWQVCFLIATILGYSQEQVQKCFLRIRKCMCDPAYQLSYNEELPQILKRCKEKGIRTILMSNTIEEGADYFLETMHMKDSFDQLVFGAQKPFHSLTHFQNLAVDLTKTLSIGDVPYNDLYPIHSQSGYTIVMSELQLRDEAFYTLHVATFLQLNMYLESLLEKNGELA